MADNFQGKSDFRAPLLTGSDNYNWWKGQMEAHLSRDPLMQRVVQRGPYEYRDSDGKVKDVDVLTADELSKVCLLYTSPSPRDATLSRMPSSA